MIDIAKLKKHPLSFRLLEEWVEKNQETVLSLYNGTTRNEDVLLFLDEQNINIQISIKSALDGSRWYLPYIWSDSDGCDFDEHLAERDNRTEATEQAIEVGFGLLEQKLKTN